MKQNKICVTQKGIDLLQKQKQQINQRFISQSRAYLSNSNQNILLNSRSKYSSNLQYNKNNKLLTSRKSSLPLLSTFANTHYQKSTQKDLSNLSLKLIKLQKIGLKKMKIMQQDQKMKNKLLDQIKNNQKLRNQKYLKLVIPEVVKKTRDYKKGGNLQSRLQRGRAYIQRLQHNFRSSTMRNYGNSNQFDQL